jgi:hypothetical protein
VDLHRASPIRRGLKAPLTDEIRLAPEDGRLRIDLHGELAGILALASGSKKPDRGGSGAEQIKLVAGACNHLYRTVVRLSRRAGS